MGSFADGMKMGQGAYQMALNNQRQEEKDAREKVIQGREDADYERAAKLRTATDDAFTAQQGLMTNGKYAGGNTSGFSDGSAEMLFNQGGQKLVDDTASYANAENRRFGLAPTNTTSSPAEPGGQAQPTVKSRVASPLEIEQGYGGIAALQRDVAGMRTSTEKQKTLKYDEGFATKRKEWGEMADGAKGALIKQLSDDAGVKGYGTWTPGKGKTQGYMTYLPPTGDPVQLSNKEAGELYALTHMMDVDPARARSEMDKVSDKVAALASHAFEAQTKGITANNTAVHSANTDANGRITAGAAATNAATNRDYKNEQVQGLRDAQTRRDQAAEVVGLYESLTPEQQAGPSGAALVRQFNMINAKAGGQVSLGGQGRGAGAPREASSADVLALAKELVGTPIKSTTPGGAPRTHDINTAYAAATNQLRGQGALEQGGYPAWGEKPKGDSQGLRAPAAQPKMPPAQGTYRVISKMGPDSAYVMLSTGELRQMSYKELHDYKFQPE